MVIIRDSMAHSEPYKRKKRAVLRTLLISGEGKNEEIFIKYLCALYARNSGVKITVQNGRGGSADYVVLDATKERATYDKRVVIIDNDKGIEEMSLARELAKKHNIGLLEHTPCLEAILLSVLYEKMLPQKKGSQWCKSKFETDYIAVNKRNEKSAYERVFPKSLLDTARTRVKELDLLISLVEGNW